MLETGSIPEVWSKPDELGYQDDGEGVPEGVGVVRDCGFNLCVVPLYESYPFISGEVRFISPEIYSDLGSRGRILGIDILLIFELKKHKEFTGFIY
jgi:hypothetical protein